MALELMQKVARVLKKGLFHRRWLDFIFIWICIRQFYSHFLTRSTESNFYQAEEMLLNYQGGLIRRGLIGELIFQVNRTGFTINIFDLNYLLGLTIWALIIGWLYFETANGKWLDRFILLFSPVLIMFPLQDPATFSRKEIFGLLFFIIILNLYKKIRGKPESKKNSLLIVSSIGLGILTLMHEANMLFIFPVICLLFLVLFDFTEIVREKRIPYRVLMIASLPIIISALIVLQNPGNRQQAEDICQSIAIYYSNQCDPLPQAIALLNIASERHNMVRNTMAQAWGNPTFYGSIVLTLLIVFAQTIAARDIVKLNTGIKKQDLNGLTIVLCLIIYLPTIPLYIIAADVARWISTASIVLVFTLLNQSFMLDLNQFGKSIKEYCREFHILPFTWRISLNQANWMFFERTIKLFSMLFIPFLYMEHYPPSFLIFSSDTAILKLPFLELIAKSFN
ncbi:MAG: hypothetical protein F6K19_25520 [Cyanothece sp. SIO1E1]|nr:hypothetical protein [Cyanothece sp. SIO1E1]